MIFCFSQVAGYLVAFEVANIKEAGEGHDFRDLGDCRLHNGLFPSCKYHSLADILNISQLPWAIYFQLVSIFDIEMCLEQWPSRQKEKYYFFFGNLLACYVLPMIIIMICYSLIWFKVSACSNVDLELQLFPIYPQVSHRDIPGETKDAQKDRIQQQSKIKVVKMLALVVFLFVLSWLPLYSVFSYYKLGECRPKTTKCNQHFATQIVAS